MTAGQLELLTSKALRAWARSRPSPLPGIHTMTKAQLIAALLAAESQGRDGR